jgi:hypothetical protein
MPDAPYRLFDEGIVRNIMLSTSNSVIDYFRENGTASADEIADFIETNAEDIVKKTVLDLKKPSGIIDGNVEDCREDDFTQNGQDE